MLAIRGGCTQMSGSIASELAPTPCNRTTFSFQPNAATLAYVSDIDLHFRPLLPLLPSVKSPERLAAHFVAGYSALFALFPPVKSPK